MYSSFLHNDLENIPNSQADTDTHSHTAMFMEGTHTNIEILPIAVPHRLLINQPVRNEELYSVVVAFFYPCLRWLALLFTGMACWWLEWVDELVSGESSFYLHYM